MSVIQVRSALKVEFSQISLEEELQLLLSFEESGVDREEYLKGIQSYFEVENWEHVEVELADFWKWDLENTPDVGSVGKILPSYKKYFKKNGSFNGCHLYSFTPPKDSEHVLRSDTVLSVLTNDTDETILYWNVDCG